MLGRFWQNMPKEEKFLKQELKNAYEKVSTGTELRAGLIEMKNLLKEEKNRRELAYQLGGDFKILTRCLSDEDPKVRKNAALVLGAMESDDLVPVLLNAYKKEDTLFVKSAYLKGAARKSSSVFQGAPGRVTSTGEACPKMSRGSTSLSGS